MSGALFHCYTTVKGYLCSTVWLLEWTHCVQHVSSLIMVILHYSHLCFLTHVYVGSFDWCWMHSYCGCEPATSSTATSPGSTSTSVWNFYLWITAMWPGCGLAWRGIYHCVWLYLRILCLLKATVCLPNVLCISTYIIPCCFFPLQAVQHSSHIFFGTEIVGTVAFCHQQTMWLDPVEKRVTLDGVYSCACILMWLWYCVISGKCPWMLNPIIPKLVGWRLPCDDK